MLYPTELRADRNSPGAPWKALGRGGEIRTPDILLPKQARYQTALHPEGGAIITPVFAGRDQSLRGLRHSVIDDGDEALAGNDGTERTALANLGPDVEPPVVAQQDVLGYREPETGSAGFT
jgi:hypothetical protein